MPSRVRLCHQSMVTRLQICTSYTNSIFLFANKLKILGMALPLFCSPLKRENQDRCSLLKKHPAISDSNWRIMKGILRVKQKNHGVASWYRSTYGLVILRRLEGSSGVCGPTLRVKQGWFGSQSSYSSLSTIILPHMSTDLPSPSPAPRQQLAQWYCFAQAPGKHINWSPDPKPMINYVC